MWAKTIDPPLPHILARITLHYDGAGIIGIFLSKNTSNILKRHFKLPSIPLLCSRRWSKREVGGEPALFGLAQPPKAIFEDGPTAYPPWLNRLSESYTAYRLIWSVALQIIASSSCSPRAYISMYPPTQGPAFPKHTRRRPREGRRKRYIL